MTGRRGWAGAGLAWWAAAPLLGGVGALAQTDGRQTYFDFGTVVAVDARSVELQSFDAKLGRMVQYSFVRNHETRSDVVHVGEQVEVIFTAGDEAWTARRVLLLPAGFPLPGPPGNGQLAPASHAAQRENRAASGEQAASSDAKTVTRNSLRGLPPTPIVRAARPASTVDLGAKTVTKPPAVIEVPLGVSAGYSTPAKVPATRSVARETPSLECHRSDAEWPAEPLRIAVLDFRYPTEREEAHDMTKASGGSGMAVADIVFERLKRQPDFQVDRGDRRRLDRSDIAGAARVGRELGVDAVLEGTFFPIEDPPAEDGSAGRLRGYELHAGLVDTCTGVVLMKLASVQCPPGIAAGTAAPACTHLAVTPRDAEDPESNAGAFNAAIAAMLFPLEHNGAAQGADASSLVDATNGDEVTVRLAKGAAVRVGDQLAVEASRLAKNPVTYTLQDLHGQEIGRVTVRILQGGIAKGIYTGDVPPRAGDKVEVVRE